MNKQIVIVNYSNSSTVGYHFKSDVKLDPIDIHNWLVHNDDFDAEKDSFTIIEEVIDVSYTKNPIK